MTKKLVLIFIFCCLSEFIFSQNKDAINISVSKQNAQFPGGEIEFYKFIIEKVQDLYDNDIVDRKGKVLLQFTIDTAGDVIDIYVLESLSPELDMACVNIIKSMPKWDSGTYLNKIPKKTQFAVPFQFIKPNSSRY